MFTQAEQSLRALFAEHALSFDLQTSAQITPLVRAVALSDFVLETLQKQPELLKNWLATPPTLENADHYGARLQALTTEIADEEVLHAVLRRFRHRELAALSYLQSNGLGSPQAIFERLSDLAEALILSAEAWLFEQMCVEYGTPMNVLGEVQRLIILGMGKLGGRELNFSSDIDLIFTYPEAGETVGGRKPMDNHKFFTRLGQRLIRALDEITADGFVYRTDMRLRPFGESGALALSFAAMEDYYQEQGRDWERYAMIKAKILGEDLTNPDHKYLKSLLRPFVYRRYLDFSAIQSLREMKQKISREVLRRGLSDNIKLGAGGIREVEFIVQAFQLMRGGRDKILQQRSLLAVLPHLATLNLLSHNQVETLRNAYLFLRQVENVLQAIDDKQTQTLPTDEREREILIAAALLSPVYGRETAKNCDRQFFAERGQTSGYFPENTCNPSPSESLQLSPPSPVNGRGNAEHWQDFLALLHFHQNNVRRIFNELIGEEEESTEEENEKLAAWRDVLHAQITQEELALNLRDYAVNEQDYAAIFQHLSTTFQEWVKRPIGVRGREVLRKLLPAVVDQIFSHSDYLHLLPRILNIIDKITTRTTYLELLLEKEQILPQLLTLCGQSMMLAEQIARHPMLLDELVLNRNEIAVLALDEYATALNEYLLRIPEEDEEAMIDGLRQFKQTHILRIAATDILGQLPVMKISDHLTYLAEAIIGAVVNLTWKSVSRRFGTPAHLQHETQEKDFVVIGYGKLGGIELGYNSDLDLVFLHNAPEESETVGGKKSISAHQFYLKLAQKINSIFNLNTSAGVLYEVDMRLRPSGEAGLLVSTFNAYEQYQKSEAWTWESQALVRARAVYGSPDLQEKFEQIRRNVLAKPRTSGQLRTEICEMREKMYAHLSSASTEKFHLKNDRGGITDIEFLAQFLVLNHAHDFPQMAVWSDNVRIFDSAVECGILTPTEGENLKNSYTTMRNQIHHLNLLGQANVVDENEFVAQRAKVREMWEKYLS